MNKVKILATTVLSAALVPWVAGKAEAAIVQTIDPLTTTQTLTRSTGGSSTNNKANLLGTIFSTNLLNKNITRRLTLQTSGTGASAIDIPTLNFGAGIDVSSPNGVNPKATIQYRGTLAGAKFSPVDLTVGGLADRVSLGIILNDVPLNQSTTFSVTLGSGTTVVTKSIVSDIDYNNPNRPLPIEFLFSSFTGINPNAINTFSIMIDPPTNGDVSLSILGVGDDRPFATTPEPTTILGLFAVAGATSTLLRKNRQEK